MKTKAPFRLSLLALAALALAGAVGAQAQTTDAERIKALEQELSQNKTLLLQLTQRLSALEQQRGAAAPTAPASPEVASRVDTLERTVADLASGSSHASTDVGLPLHGFLDVGYAHLSRSDANTGKPGFRVGTFDIYLTPS